METKNKILILVLIIVIFYFLTMKKSNNIKNINNIKNSIFYTSEVCQRPIIQPSVYKHLYPKPIEKNLISRIAFSSCYEPFNTETQRQFWQHVRDFNPDIWIWLGDNAYSDTSCNMNLKRIKYNEVRDNPIYNTIGPIGEPKIPVIGTWDDHDYGEDNRGIDFPFALESQIEFVYHFNIPQSDPRHFVHEERMQRGVYSSHLFKDPENNRNVHIILLDNRSSRDATYEYSGLCKGEKTRMLSDEQWRFLEDQLKVKSEIKIIGSGIQILPPTNQDVQDIRKYCSYSDQFQKDINELGEDDSFKGTDQEIWGEIPHERKRLLQICQDSVNKKYTKRIIFISGDQHWGEISLKRMPRHSKYGKSVDFFEVTASGIDQNWIKDVPNSNRLKVKENDEKVIKNIDIKYSGNHGCSGDYSHICSAVNNYGQIEIDWETNSVYMRVITPTETEFNSIVPLDRRTIHPSIALECRIDI